MELKELAQCHGHYSELSWEYQVQVPILPLNNTVTYPFEASASAAIK